jgi:hypothetical protein
MNNEIFRVKAAEGGWCVFTRDGSRVSDLMHSQSDAVVHAKELATRCGSAQIVIYNPGGQVQSEFIYQREERASLSHDDSAPTMAATHVAHKSPPRL